MAIPASGPISISMFNEELSRTGTTANSELAGAATPTVGSLVYIAGQLGSLDQSAPHSFSEWYNYTATPVATTTAAPTTTTSTTTTTTTVPPTTTTTTTTTTSTTTTTTTFIPSVIYCMGYSLGDCCVAKNDYDINCAGPPP